MSRGPRSDFLQLISVMAQMKGVALNELTLRIYDDTGKKVGYEKCLNWAKEVFNSSNFSLPAPGFFLEKANPKLDASTVGYMTATAIISAVTKHGMYNYTDAKADLGELGEWVVKQLGGWHAVCTSRADISVLRAHIRDLIIAAKREGEVKGQIEAPLAKLLDGRKSD